jgi:hypothetical protein
MSFFKREKGKEICPFTSLDFCPQNRRVTELAAELSQLRSSSGNYSVCNGPCGEKTESKLNRFSFELSEIRGQLSHLRNVEEKHTLNDRAVILHLTGRVEKVEAAISALRARTNTLRTEQINIDKRLRALECRQNAVTVILKNESGDKKLELNND